MFSLLFVSYYHNMACATIFRSTYELAIDALILNTIHFQSEILL
jgi:hypothetical protein